MQHIEPMQGVKITYDANDQPAVLTFDIQNLDPVVILLVNELVVKMEQETEAADRADWRLLAHAALNRIYSDSEPDYTDIPPCN